MSFSTGPEAFLRVAKIAKKSSYASMHLAFLKISTPPHFN